MTLHLYGLLHVADRAALQADPARLPAHSVDVYLRNAATLAASAQAAVMPFSVLSNAAPWLEARLARLGLAGAVQVKACDYARDVPDGIPFQAAHHKLDLIAAFAAGALGDQVALIDLDMVVQRPFALSDADALYVYDIWDQVAPAYGAERIRTDLARFGVANDAQGWFGGEFIAGSPARFAELTAEIEAIWPAYVAALGQTHHTGDEMVVTCALLRLAAKGARLRDAGALDVVRRWWSARTLSPMAAFRQFQGAAMLHLPADKDYLAARAGQGFDPRDFPVKYRAHARRRRWLGALKNGVDALRGRPLQHLPRLG